eukprot:Nitzschia sp. Nitz4//scaffold185_size43419//6339//7160//NITZ4_007294-RA/size43419-processed-gene-0.68-mRNA-1//1//CDS//3329539688//4622//frame0
MASTSSSTTCTTTVQYTSPLLRIPSNNTTSTAPSKIGLILLNTPITVSPLFQHLWDTSTVRLCADGGANRLFNATAPNHTSHLPQGISGDLDSLQDHVATYYQSQGVQLRKDPSQDSNDLTKCLEWIVQDWPDVRRVFVYGAFGGRFDQEMASFQSLYAWADQFHDMWLYGEETCAVLLPAKQMVELELACYTSNAVREGPTCGLIPLAAPCESATTTGFKWNLEDTPMHFGGLVSTSNHIMEPERQGSSATKVTVQASSPLIFTLELLQQES